jgi:drug/metabolite transporter, DME family
VGVLFVLGAALAWSTGGLGVKLVDAPAPTIAGYRALFASLVLAAAVSAHAERVGLGTLTAFGALVRRPLLWGAAVGYAVMVVSFVVAAKITTAANAILLQYTAPIYVALLSWPLLRERVRWWDGAAVLLCLGGMALFFRDQVSSSARTGDLIAILGGFGFAALPLQLRLDQRRLEAGASADPRLAAAAPLFACLLGNLLAVAATMPWMWSAPPPDARSWGVVGALGVVQIGLAYVLYGVGVRRLRAVESMLVSTLEPLLAPVWVLLGTGERPGRNALLGGAVIVATVTAQGLLVSTVGAREREA